MQDDGPEFDFKARNDLMVGENYQRKDLIVSLMKNEISAAEAAIELNKTFIVMN